MKKVISKIWGHEEIFINSKNYCFKKLNLVVNFISSYHYHIKKDESFIIGENSSDIYMCVEGIKFKMQPGNFIHMPPGYKHQFAAMKNAPTYFYEVSTEDSSEDSIRLTKSGVYVLPVSILYGLQTFRNLCNSKYDINGNPTFPITPFEK